MLHNEKLKGRS